MKKRKGEEFEEYGTNPSNEEKIADTVNKSIEIFCLKEQEKMLTYREFLWIQFCVTQKKWWLLQMLLLTEWDLFFPTIKMRFMCRGIGDCKCFICDFNYPGIVEKQIQSMYGDRKCVLLFS